jgi:addiction module HigA family antidote
MLLEEFLKPSGITQVEAAARLRVPFQRLNTLVRGRRGVTADTALRLAKLTRMDAGGWACRPTMILARVARRDLSRIRPLKKSA